MNIPNIRLLNQQLLNPLFREPKELVSWMGAMQAQNYSMVKWAVGMRLKSATIQAVEKALHEGEILRTHVMRPTWHLVAAEDIRWMLKLPRNVLFRQMILLRKDMIWTSRMNSIRKRMTCWRRFFVERKV